MGILSLFGVGVFIETILIVLGVFSNLSSGCVWGRHDMAT